MAEVQLLGSRKRLACPKSPKRCPECADTLSEIDRNAVRFEPNNAANARVQRIHARIDNGRRDFLRKTSTAISNNHAMVCIEDLPVRNMSKSAAGTTEQPGTHVRAKASLNKFILVKAGSSSAVNWSTKWRGKAVGLWRYLRRTQAVPARAAGMCRRTTGSRKPGSSV